MQGTRCCCGRANRIRDDEARAVSHVHDALAGVDVLLADRPGAVLVLTCDASAQAVVAVVLDFAAEFQGVVVVRIAVGAVDGDEPVPGVVALLINSCSKGAAAVKQAAPYSDNKL